MYFDAEYGQSAPMSLVHAILLYGSERTIRLATVHRPLNDPQGGRYQVLAEALPEGQVKLQAGSQTQQFPITAVDPFWFGAYTLLWKPPPIQATRLMPGMHGVDVRWLRERLDILLGPSEPPLDPVFFDAELSERVRLFQRSRGLLDDGVVGSQTLIELTLETRATETQVPMAP